MNLFAPSWSDPMFYTFKTDDNLDDCESIIVTASDNMNGFKSVVEKMMKKYVKKHHKHCYAILTCKAEFRGKFCANPHFWRYIALAKLTSPSSTIAPHLRHILYMDTDAVITRDDVSIPQLAARYMDYDDKLWITSDFLCDMLELPVNNGVFLFQINKKETLTWIFDLSMSVISNRDIKPFLAKNKKYFGEHLVDQPVFTHTLIEKKLVFPGRVKQKCANIKHSWKDEMEFLIADASTSNELRTVTEFMTLLGSRSSVSGASVNSYKALNLLKEEKNHFRRYWMVNIAKFPSPYALKKGEKLISSIVNIRNSTLIDAQNLSSGFHSMYSASFVCSSVDKLMNEGRSPIEGYQSVDDAVVDSGWIVPMNEAIQNFDFLISDARWSGLQPPALIAKKGTQSLNSKSFEKTNQCFLENNIVNSCSSAHQTQFFPHPDDDMLVISREKGVLHTLPLVLNGAMRHSGVADVPATQWRWDVSFIAHFTGMNDAFRSAFLHFSCLLLLEAGRGELCDDDTMQVLKTLASEEDMQRIISRSATEQMASSANLFAGGFSVLHEFNEEMSSLIARTVNIYNTLEKRLIQTSQGTKKLSTPLPENLGEKQDINLDRRLHSNGDKTPVSFSKNTENASDHGMLSDKVFKSSNHHENLANNAFDEELEFYQNKPLQFALDELLVKCVLTFGFPSSRASSDTSDFYSLKPSFIKFNKNTFVQFTLNKNSTSLSYDSSLSDKLASLLDRFALNWLATEGEFPTDDPGGLLDGPSSETRLSDEHPLVGFNSTAAIDLKKKFIELLHYQKKDILNTVLGMKQDSLTAFEQRMEKLSTLVLEMMKNQKNKQDENQLETCSSTTIVNGIE
eukprot:GDKJ01024159.1.p1 GENE.GDKJ01024159.1~~GDKJ01024159.1.p1  ORF type:complete len:898 (-),score=176.97 GDKJ01024159.1:1225-3777(-)